MVFVVVALSRSWSCVAGGIFDHNLVHRYNVSLFVSQAVIQHFPSEQYTIDFLKNVASSHIPQAALVDTSTHIDKSTSNHTPQ